MAKGRGLLSLALMLALGTITAGAQALAGAEKARPVAGDPGISSMVVIDEAAFRVLRDYAEPGATRRMHAHGDATSHVFVLVTGRLRLTIEGQAPVEVTAGEAVSLPGGARHTFTNIGDVTSTIVEVFGKGSRAGVEVDAWASMASSLIDSRGQKREPPTGRIHAKARVPHAASPSR